MITVYVSIRKTLVPCWVAENGATIICYGCTDDYPIGDREVEPVLG